MISSLHAAAAQRVAIAACRFVPTAGVQYGPRILNIVMNYILRPTIAVRQQRSSREKSNQGRGK